MYKIAGPTSSLQLDKIEETDTTVTITLSGLQTKIRSYYGNKTRTLSSFFKLYYFLRKHCSVIYQLHSKYATFVNV